MLFGRSDSMLCSMQITIAISNSHTQTHTQVIYFHKIYRERVDTIYHSRKITTFHGVAGFPLVHLAR